jgi:phosphoglycolate phosphatase-like HAD superfamily hydrolase
LNDGHIRRLVLWDVDGTLVDSAKLGRDAFLEAFEVVTGSPPRRLVPFAGRTDLEIALDLFDASGLAGGEGLLEPFGEALAAAMAARSDELRRRGRALPGAREALERLRAEPGVVQSLLTGNIAVNAAVKLGAFGLERAVDFEIGAYGSDHRMRGELVAVARAKAERKHGVPVPPDRVVVIGDTPLDVVAAREGGARAVAVATGPYGADDLREAAPDVVLGDLSNLDALLAAVL